MVFIQRIGEGLRLIKEAFVFLWEYKILAAYPALAMLCFASVQLLIAAAYGIWTFNFLPDQKLVTHALHNSNYLFVILLFFVQSFLVTFFALRLAHHTTRLMHREKTSISQELKAGLSYLLQTVFWSAILVVITSIQYGIAIRYQILSQTNPTLAWTYNSLQIILLIWILFTCYVIPSIALEKRGVVQAVKVSMRLVTKTWLEIITGFGVLLLLTTILVAPAVLWFSTMSTGALLINIILVWPAQCIGSAISTMFTTIAYHYFYKQPREEMDMFRYPEF